MAENLQQSCDAVLQGTVNGATSVPGVVAMATDKNGAIYQGAAGKRNTAESTAMTEDTVFCIFSCTKGITATAVMQLVEQGELDLDAPASNYLPALGDVQVLDGFGSAGKPILRTPRTAITTKHLLLHTAGFAYDFFNEDYLRLTTDHGLPSVITSSKAALQAPLLFDPGTDWHYGINIDWAGQVVEAITGRRLGEVMQTEIFEPLGMSNTGFSMSPDMKSRLAVIHQREADDALTPLADLILPQEPEVHMGGHGLYSTAGDYLRFIRMLLNDGQGDNGRVLKPETVQMMSANQLDPLKIGALKSVIPSLSNDAEFFPGQPKSWSYSFMVNDEQAPTGRPAGAIGWAGLANLFYWADRENGVGGFWATQILPFADPASFTGYMAFEKAVYDARG